MTTNPFFLFTGMVLILSLWDDHAAHMLWLDSNYPADGDPSVPGIARGPCSTDSGDPEVKWKTHELLEVKH